MWNTDSSSSSPAGLRRLCHREARNRPQWSDYRHNSSYGSVIATRKIPRNIHRLLVGRGGSNFTCTTLGRSPVNIQLAPRSIHTNQPFDLKSIPYHEIFAVSSRSSNLSSRTNSDPCTSKKIPSTGICIWGRAMLTMRHWIVRL